MTIDGEDSASIQRLDVLRTEDLIARRFVPEAVDLAWDRNMAGSFFVTEDGFVTGLANGVHIDWARFVRTDGGHEKGAIESLAEWPLHDILRARDSSQVIYVVGSASEPDHVMQGTLDGLEIKAGVEIHRPNKGFVKQWLAKTEITRWAGAGGDEVEGIVYSTRGASVSSVGRMVQSSQSRARRRSSALTSRFVPAWVSR